MRASIVPEKDTRVGFTESQGMCLSHQILRCNKKGGNAMMMMILSCNEERSTSC